MSICPKDGKPCVDDLCRGSGVCMRTGMEMWETCPMCHRVFSDEFDIRCACEPDYEPDDYGDDR